MRGLVAMGGPRGPLGREAPGQGSGEAARVEGRVVAPNVARTGAARATAAWAEDRMLGRRRWDELIQHVVSSDSEGPWESRALDRDEGFRLETEFVARATGIPRGQLQEIPRGRHMMPPCTPPESAMWTEDLGTREFGIRSMRTPSQHATHVSRTASTHSETPTAGQQKLGWRHVGRSAQRIGPASAQTDLKLMSHVLKPSPKTWRPRQLPIQVSRFRREGPQGSALRNGHRKRPWQDGL